MNEVKYPSELLENLVNEFHRLPGVGRKTALRYALHLLKEDEADAMNLGNSILRLICVVESVADVMAVENTAQFNGVYHVLGGVISPMNGIGPADLDIPALVQRVAEGGIDEVILALSPDMEGDTTCLYIYKKLADYNIEISTIARGVAVGNSLEYADEITLGRSIVNRIKYSL